MPPKDPTSNSGITTSASGDRVIPSSVRADGSVRKEIRVKPGYKPPEDVEVYKNRAAEAFKNRGKAGVPGATFVETPAPPKKSKIAQAHANKQVLKDVAAADELKLKGRAHQPLDEPPTAEPRDPEVEKEKEARKLSKKLRQAKDLQQKKAQGDALLPEQLEKVIRINELIRQLETLGFDSEGNKKD